MTSIYCPYCHRFVELSNRGSFGTQHGEYWMGQCNSCQKVVLKLNSTGEVFPIALPKPVDDRIKQAIKADFIEARKCFAVGAFRAAAVMARRAMQNICLDKGANEDFKLEKQIDELFSKNIITTDLKDWAHEVRLVGNDGAHPKKAENEVPVTFEDAEDILNLLEQFCQVLYIAPAIANQRKKVRENQ